MRTPLQTRADACQSPSDLFWRSGSTEKRVAVELVAGRSYPYRIVFHSPATFGEFGRGGFNFGGHLAIPIDQGIADAVAAARRADTVICVVGLTADWEGEAFDRPHMDLPPDVDNLVRSVLQANPTIVVVLQSGTPVTLPWIDSASTVMQAWFGGGELGHGIADVLFGDVNPAARLSLSWPRRLSDTPTAHFGARAFPGVDGKVHYDEKLSVGYRWYDEATAPDPLFAFGHGLSYTSFRSTVLKLPDKVSSDGSLSFVVNVSNTGSRPGREIVQVRSAPCCSR